jgi:CheY-like chemotaxis protein
MAKILLVEDDKSLREIYGVRLLAEGYDIVSAGDGEEALAMAIKERPQLIVSDVMMPKISGFDMLDILRSTTETKGIKVIMMTALSSEDQRQRGEQLGADRYLVKSQVGIEDVVRTVHEVLGDSLTPQNAFGTGAPSAVPRPAPAVQPRPEPAAAPAAAPIPAPQPTPAQPQPVATMPSPTPQPVAPTTSLPQPTAPFSTPRPAGLADRIIQPLEKPDDASEPIASLMDRELGASAPAEPVMPAAPAAPPAPPVPTPVTPPTVSLPPAPVAPQPPQGPTDGITFEETPRPTNQ